MLKLTKTGIGLLTRQYRSVLKKCWLINVGIWRTAEDIISKTRKMMAYMLGLLDSLLNIKSNAFDEQSTKATATELPFGAPTVAGTLTAFGANVLDGLSEKRVFTTKLITSTAIGLMVATMAMPSDAAGIAVEGELDVYGEGGIYQYYYAKYTRSSARFNYLDVQTSYGSTGTNGPYFDLETFLTDLSAGRLFVSGAITTHDIKTGAVTDDKIASGITASKITQDASYRFVSDTEKATWNGYSTTIAGKADSATTLSGYGITDAYTKNQVDNLISQAGGGSVDLSDYYTKSEIYNKTEIENIQSLNNYYRKNKKSGILNRFEAGKIGNKNDDNFSKFRADNDNFATKNGDFATNNLSRLGAFAKCEKACPRLSERFPASLEKNSVFEQYSRSARGTFLFVSQTHKNVLDSFSKLTANDNFAITTFLRAI